MRKSLLRTNRELLDSLELAVDLAVHHCLEEEREGLKSALVWVETLKKELDEPLLKTCKLSQILRCSNEYFEICDEKEELRKELLEAKNKVNVMLTSITASKLRVLS